MAEYINKESILDKIGSLPLCWEYGQAVHDIYEMVEAEPVVRIGRCKDCAKLKRGGTGYGWCGDTPRQFDAFCSDFKPKEGQ